MPTQTGLLRTKFFVPHTTSTTVARVRLVKHMCAENARPLTLISAAAGAGKTSLLREWIETEHPRVAWLSLDEGDNDPTRFWTHVIGALQTSIHAVGASCLDAMHSPQPVPLESALNLLLNDAAALQSRITLVLDDYHVIAEKAIHDSLTYFLDHLPPFLYLTIATRVDPMLPLGRMRARGLLTELRDGDLRFTHHEAEQFLNQIMALNLTVEDIAALEQRTEGWIVGLQMAALSLQRFDDAASRSHFIRSFAGDDRYILDYLLGEVLQRQPVAVQRFLLDTSVLEQLSAPLCEAVTGAAHAQATLEMLEHGNLFLIPLDNRREWYRYHHLFVDLLRHQLRRTDGTRAAELHQRAAAWFEAQGLIPQAIEHASAAGDIPTAVRLISGLAHVMLMSRSEPYTLLRWVQSLPEGTASRFPELGIAHAWALIGLSQPEQALRLVQAARAAMPAEIPPPMQGEIAMLHATIGVINGNVPLIMEHAPIAVELTHEDTPLQRSFALWMLGQVYRFQGDAVRAEATFAEAARLAETCDSQLVMLMATGNRADRLIEQGRLREGLHIHRTLQTRLQQGKQRPPSVVSDSFIWSAYVMLEWNDLDAAEADIVRGLEINQNVFSERIVIATLFRARIAAAHGDTTRVLALLDDAKRLAEQHKLPHMILRAGAAQAWFAVTYGRKESAERWLNAVGYPQAMQHIFDSEVLMIIARILIACSRIDEALKLLKEVRAAAEQGGRFKTVIETQVIEALAHQERHHMAEALDALEHALVMAHPEGFLRVFLDEGAPMAALLQLARGQNTPPVEYVREILRAFTPTSTPNDHLSDRENDILRLLAQGCTNIEIAERLYLSVNTVKTHMKHIYEKLNVANRVEAAERARDLGLLP